MIEDSYVRLTSRGNLPKYEINGKVTNIEQSVMRGIHDLLPGIAKLVRRISRRKILILQTS